MFLCHSYDISDSIDRHINSMGPPNRNSSNRKSNSRTRPRLHLRDVDSDGSDEFQETVAGNGKKFSEKNETVAKLESEHCNLENLPEDTFKMDENVRRIMNKLKKSKVPVLEINQPREDFRLIERSESLEKERYTISTFEAVELKMLKQYPSQQNADMPLFELAKLSKEYQQMEKDMVLVYKSFPSVPYIRFNNLKVGIHAVLRSRKDEEEEEEDDREEGERKKGDEKDDIFVLKRIKILSIENPAVVKIEYIDYGFKAIVNSVQSDILMLDKSFAVLPPRVCDIEMEGLSHYGDGRMRKYVCYNSEEYVFDGLLTAELQTSGKVLVWSERFPKDQFKYGINGYILMVMWSVMGKFVRLAPQGHHSRDCFVVNADHEGYVDIQLNSVMSKHYIEVFASVTNDTIKRLCGSVTEVRKDVIYMAPHIKTDGTYYRAIVSESALQGTSKNVTSPGEVYMQYIDYGDVAKVKIKDLIQAKDAHYLLSKFPKMCVRAHLDNIWSLEAEKYFAMFHAADQMYTVHVIKSAIGQHPEVIIKYEDANGTKQILNKVIVEKELADAVLPFKDFQQHVDLGPKIMNLTYKAHLYLRLQNGKRLKHLDKLDVDLIFNKAMPDGYFFIRPASYRNKWLEFEQELESLNQQISEGSKSNSNYYNTWILDKHELFPGRSVLCESRIVKQLARGVIIAKSEQIQNENQEESQSQSQSNAKLDCWEVYLPDYGISELFFINALLRTEIHYATMLPFGCLASHADLKTKEAIWNWWDNLSDHVTKPRIGMDYLYSLVYDRNYYSQFTKVERTVEILRCKYYYPYGETLRIEWC